ncbi:MAG: hypothetical protein ACR2QO_05415 [Acidimicrobiales bacterium]
MTIAAYVPNLFDRSRFSDRVIFVESAADAAASEPTLLLVDLDRCDDIEAFALPGVRLIGFGPHVDSEAQAEATSAGYDEVLPRSSFFRRLPEILGGQQ